MRATFTAVIALALFAVAGTCNADEYPPRWHNEYLRYAGEPSLVDARGGVEEYRFFHWTTFGDPIFVRATRIGDIITLRAVQFTGSRVLREKRVALTVKEWRTIVLLVGKSGFWNMATDDDNITLDGTTWLMEGRRNGAYRATTRSSPSFESQRRELVPFVLLGRYLMKLSGLGLNVD